jgi:hypothetical protein
MVLDVANLQSLRLLAHRRRIVLLALMLVRHLYVGLLPLGVMVLR